MNKEGRYSLDIEKKFEKFILEKANELRFKKAQNKCAKEDTLKPNNSTKQRIMSPYLEKTSPIPIIKCETISPRTPSMQNYHGDHLLLPSYRLAHVALEETPQYDSTKLQPTTDGNGKEIMMPSPRTPKGLVNIWKPLPGYRLERLRHHIHSHRPQRYR